MNRKVVVEQGDDEIDNELLENEELELDNESGDDQDQDNDSDENQDSDGDDQDQDFDAGDGDSGEDDDDQDEVVISLDGEAPPQDDEDNKAPYWVRELRKSNRETQKENKELKAKIAELSGDNKPVELGPKPTLESCDYDDAAYAEKLEQWFDAKKQADEQQREAQAAQERQAKEWQDTLDSYGEKKTQLKVRDFDDAEANVIDEFSETQRGVIIHAADNAAQLIYALGKSPKAREELSKIKDPVKFAFAAAKLETKLKVTTRKAATKPERTVSGGGRSSGTTDSTLERLRAEAEKSGDYTKVRQYKKQKRSA